MCALVSCQKDASDGEGDGAESEHSTSCLALGELNGPSHLVSEVEGGRARCYRVTLANDGVISIQVRDEEPFGVAVELYGGAVEKSHLDHESALRSVPSRDGGTIVAPLPRGEHVVSVYGSGEYDLDLDFEANGEPSLAEDPSPNPDLDAASLDIAETVRVGGYVGPLDTADVYRVELSEAGTLTFAVPQASGAFAQSLYGVGADDGAFQENEKLAELPSRDGASLERTLGSGVYFLEIRGDSVYTLVASFVPGEP